ncbi:MAG TPA: hypothetical protein VHV28_01315 [Solirubrobacteraceae bacterium]|nr:hypothetical protein [Solirubrobacteraceae bacterium]
MDTVLITLEDGPGVVRRAGGMTLVTGDIAEGWGAFVRREDPYQPVSTSPIVACRVCGHWEREPTAP